MEQYRKWKPEYNTSIYSLTDREAVILYYRRCRKPRMTLWELGRMYGVTIERIRQLEAKAEEKVRRLSEINTLLND